jgi:hypothetical protein
MDILGRPSSSAAVGILTRQLQGFQIEGGSTPMKTDLNPHGAVNGCGAAYCKRIACL